MRRLLSLSSCFQVCIRLPSWGHPGPPGTQRQGSRHRGPGLGPSRSSAPLRPKRPTGRMPRPAYQAGLMSGAGKEGPGQLVGVPSLDCAVLSGVLWLWETRCHQQQGCPLHLAPALGSPGTRPSRAGLWGGEGDRATLGRGASSRDHLAGRQPRGWGSRVGRHLGTRAEAGRGWERRALTADLHGVLPGSGGGRLQAQAQQQQAEEPGPRGCHSGFVEEAPPRWIRRTGRAQPGHRQEE